MTVTISPGVTPLELLKVFYKEKVTFESDVIVPTATFGGIVSSGSHVR